MKRHQVLILAILLVLTFIGTSCQTSQHSASRAPAAPPAELPALTLRLAWNGENYQVPPPAMIPEEFKKSAAYRDWEKIGDIPATTSISDKISKDLKKMGFKFVGSTIIYSFMQAVGMVNDHITECFVYKEMMKG